VVVNGEAQIVLDDWDRPLTPSCVAVNERGELEVGHGAVQVLRVDNENAAAGFKRFMGKRHVWTFPATGATYSPEDLSAFVLESLRHNVERHLGSAVDAAVITIPANFGERERAATLGAARKAGFSHVELVQEPIAAGLAYGWNRTEDNRPFLVYDLGGGTFDAALLQVEAGQLVVRKHKGVETLGGRDIDADILDRLITPRLAGRVSAEELARRRGELLYRAEEAKRGLSRVTRVSLAIEGCIQDVNGRPVEDVITITRAEIEPFVDKLVAPTIRAVEEVLQEAGLSANDLRAIVLVGGPTRIPRLRALLTERFGEILEGRIDPMTVVARGAALHAASILRRRSAAGDRPRMTGLIRLRVQFPPVSDANTVPVGIAGEDVSLPDGTTIRLTRADGGWQSGRIAVQNGRAVTRVLLGDERQSTFRIELFDIFGASVRTDPDQFVITRGLAAAPPPLSRSIGVSVAGPDRARVHRLAEAGTPLPLTVSEWFRTTRGVRAGDTDVVLEVHVLEGESDHPLRCRTVGRVTLSGGQIDQSLPANSEVEVSIRIEPSKTIEARVFIPFLDRTITEVFRLEQPPPPSVAELREKLSIERDSMQQLHRSGVALPSHLSQSVRQVEEDLRRATAGDAEAALRADSTLHELSKAVEEAERREEPRLLAAKVEELVAWTKDLVEQFGDDEQHALVEQLQERAREAQADRSMTGLDKLRDIERELLELARKVYWSQPGAWIARFQKLASGQQYTDPERASFWIAEGRRALELGDTQLLRQAVFALTELVEGDDRLSLEDRLTWLRPM
jgi:molecular chaperone DnaK